MKYQTTIDTVGLQIDSIYEDTRNAILEEILALYIKNNLYIAHKNYPINQHSNFYIREYHIYANNVVIASISTRSFSVKNRVTNQVITTYYITLEFAGLMSYNEKLDKTSNDTLLKTCAYLNTKNITFKLTGMDICIDLNTKYENVLALCTRKSPKTEYYRANEVQFYDTTSYLEKIPRIKLNLAVQRTYLYDKSIKENLPNNLTRFEVKLQPKFFNKNRNNIISGIINVLDRYHVMYLPNKKEKNYLMEQYDNQHILRHRDIKRLKFNKYRCHPDISVVVSLINHMSSIQVSSAEEKDIFAKTKINKLMPLMKKNF